MKAVILSGSRDWGTAAEWDAIEHVIMKSAPDILIHGAARGADNIGKELAEDLGVPSIEPFPADWVTHKKAAGYIRNSAMLARLRELEEEGYDIRVWLFHNELKEGGTRMMGELAIRAGVTTIWFRVINGTLVWDQVKSLDDLP